MRLRIGDRILFPCTGNEVRRALAVRAKTNLSPKTILSPLLLGVVFLVGCRQDMHDQPKYQPHEVSDFFADGRTSRTPVEGTVARGWLAEDPALYQGVDEAGQMLASIPLPLTAELVARGRERFDIFCSPCHGRTGDGTGMIVQRGFKQPESFHSERLRGVEVGYFFNVMTNGFGQMSSYAAQVPVEDRWAIAAYVQALQLSRNAPVAALADDDLAKLDAPPADGSPAWPEEADEHGAAH